MPEGNDSAEKAVIEDILDCLNKKKTRCTYGAVGGLLGVIARSVGRRLGDKRPKASWVVNKKTGLPTGYRPEEMHPDLEKKEKIITSADELREFLNFNQPLGGNEMPRFGGPATMMRLPSHPPPEVLMSALSEFRWISERQTGPERGTVRARSGRRAA